MNDQEALKQINWALDEYLKVEKGGSALLFMSRVAQTLGRNTQWNRNQAA
jgi:hypothetical protein